VHAFLRLVDQVKVSDAQLEKRRRGFPTSAGIDPALRGIRVMMKALGGRAKDLFAPVKLFSEATRLFVTAMERKCDSRLISVAGFDANDGQTANKNLHLLPFWVFLGQAFGEKDAQERWVKGRELNCAIARPGILVTDPGSGHYKALIEQTR
jgi:hypothetical protein